MVTTITKRGVTDMKKRIAILLITIMAFGAAACQPTPESNCHHEAPPSYGIEAESPDLEEVNHYKNTNATWEEEFTGKSDSLTIRVNAVLPIGIDNIKSSISPSHFILTGRMLFVCHTRFGATKPSMQTHQIY